MLVKAGTPEQGFSKDDMVNALVWYYKTKYRPWMLVKIFNEGTETQFCQHWLKPENNVYGFSLEQFQYVFARVKDFIGQRSMDYKKNDRWGSRKVTRFAG